MKAELFERIAAVDREAVHDLAGAADLKTAEECRVKYLGRNGVVQTLLKDLRGISSDDRPEVGKRLNDLKQKLEAELGQLIHRLAEQEQAKTLSRSLVDVTLPGRHVQLGHRHPVTQVMEEVVRVFMGLGFSVHEGPEVETEYYNFEALNVPADHPARDMQDTFYLRNGSLLRTHTSPVQIHVMERQKPPIVMIAPGVVYRRDSDVSHSPMFHQVEGLMVDDGITFGHLKGVLSLFCREMFGKTCPVRFRPSFFPFTEPSAEVDIGCSLCHGVGCRVCKQSGWLEILGCGMVDPEVFRAVDYDPSRVSGFAFGMGIERMAMLKWGIHDIRLLFENDARFLEQF